MHPQNTRLFALLGAAFAWSAVIFQLVLNLQQVHTSIPETLIRFFSYFTIQNNLLVACCFSSQGFKGLKNSFFARGEVWGAVVVYIIVVAGIYHLILSDLGHFKGWAFWVDQGLHSLNPLCFILFWYFLMPKSSIHWRHLGTWLLYPLTYCGFILLRGAYSGFYPYPFIHVDRLGWAQTALHIVGIFLLFVLLSVVIIAVARAKKDTSL